MKVTVAKTPGSRAVAVEIAEGGTVLDALKAADMDSSLGEGFEVRVGFEPAQLSDVVTNNAIVTLTAKVTGNAARVVHIAVDSSKAEPAVFVLEKVTNSKSIFSDVEVQAYILSATGATGELCLESWDAVIFGESANGELTTIKDRPLNNGTFLTAAQQLYCIVHTPTWDGKDKDADFLLNHYFKTASPAPEDTPVQTQKESIEPYTGVCCGCERECEPSSEDEGLKIPKTITVNVHEGNGLELMYALMGQVVAIAKRSGLDADIDLNVHVSGTTRSNI